MTETPTPYVPWQPGDQLRMLDTRGLLQLGKAVIIGEYLGLSSYVPGWVRVRMPSGVVHVTPPGEWEKANEEK